ncbi:Trypsin [Corynebacterium camporealensis]|nr:Trypsin [Corynebacterium camporealensis]
MKTTPLATKTALVSSLNNRRWRMLQCGGAILGAAALLVGCGSIPQLSDATDNLEDRIAEAWNNAEETDAEHEALSSEAAPEPDPIDINVAPLPPGTALDISAHEPTPGSSFNFQICTAAWSFQLEDGRTIAVTASHCAQEGETVWAGNQDGRFEYPSEPIGKVIYSDLYAEDSHGLDVAFVELYRDEATTLHGGWKRPWMPAAPCLTMSANSAGSPAKPAVLLTSESRDRAPTRRRPRNRCLRCPRGSLRHPWRFRRCRLCRHQRQGNHRRAGLRHHRTARRRRKLRPPPRHGNVLYCSQRRSCHRPGGLRSNVVRT